MKLTYTMLLAMLLVLPACNRGEQERVRASSEPTTNTDQMKQQRDAYVKSINAKLGEFDQKFDGLDERAKGMTGTAKTDFKNSVDQLRDQRKAVADKLDDLKKVNVESWMTLKGEVDAAVAGLEHSYEQVAASHETVPSAAPKAQRKTY